MYSDSLKNKTVQDFLTNVTSKFPQIFNAALFRAYKEKKAQIYPALFKNTTRAALHIYSIVLNKNILVMHDFGYEWCSSVCQERDTLCFWESNGCVGAIIDTDSHGNVDVSSILETKSDLFSERTKKIQIVTNPVMLQNSRDLSKKNIVELRNDATEKGVNINHNGKLLTKQELVDKLLHL